MKNKDFINKLRNSGLRPTKQRIKICEALFNSEKTFHFTVNDLAKIMRKNFDIKISLATVYNTLHAFKNTFAIRSFRAFQVEEISNLVWQKL